MEKSLSNLEARRWLIGGRVQGVGYRAFVFNLAQHLGLSGIVQNLSSGEVRIEAQGDADSMKGFAEALLKTAPMLARPRLVNIEPIPLRALEQFEILLSTGSPRADIHIPPDSYLCDDCRRELLDPSDRRYRYPFINCTQCGPRYTLITRMPYDRPHTTMADFPLCEACRTEYENPHDRRFHAQPLACPQCGPQLQFSATHWHASGDAALQACIEALRRGETVAVKGIGGYHLMCDAANAEAIAGLRLNKARPHKPLAVMFPWQGEDGLRRVRDELHLDKIAATALTDASRPVVLIPKHAESSLPANIAPGLNEIGAMLPYSPLHHLLLSDFGGPLIATSGNISGEPVLTDNHEAELRLAKVAQSFLHHNRPIARPADDSVQRIIAGQPRLLRAGRGIAPLEFDLPFSVPQPFLAVGGHMKNTIALAWNNRAVLSPHISDLDAPRSVEIFEQVITDLQRLYGIKAEGIVCDMHRGYASTRWAMKQGLPVQRVQHHRAHASALAFESGIDRAWLCFTWDGVGLGDDETLWGGEALLGKPGAWQRVASFKPFRLPGGERAAREPWRSAASLCWESGLDWHSVKRDVVLLRSAWEHALNSPLTSAVGRLFDAASSLLGLCDSASFEGQGPMLLEAAAKGDAEPIELPLSEENGLLVGDWTPLLHALRQDDVPVSQRAMQFHVTLAQCLVAIARRIHEQSPFDSIGLTGGVFQNKLLAEMTLQKLIESGFDAHMPQRIPCNDGGLALGQLIEAAYPHG